MSSDSRSQARLVYGNAALSYIGLDTSRISRAEAVARAIETEISAGRVSAGESLGTKEELKQRYGVAVATLNEAIKLLGARGFVEARPGPGGGVFVRPVAERHAGPLLMGFEWSEATMADYHEVRDVLEPAVIQHAVLHHTDSDIAHLYEIVERMERHLDDPAAYLKDNTDFHRSLALISPNKPLRSLYLTVIDFFGAAVDATGLPDRLHPHNLEVHRQLADAIVSGDAKLLKAAMKAHDRHRRAFGLSESESRRG